MNRAADWLAYLAHRLGAPGLLGLALLAAALLLVLLVNAPLQRETADLEARLTTAPRAGVAVLRQEELDLPRADAAPETLADLFRAARHAGLSLDEGDYRVSTDRQAGLTRQQITLPVSGKYPALRGFLAEILNRHPNLALDSLRLHRGEAGAGELDATLRLTLYLREAP